MTVQILIGDARERLRELPDASVHCCVTSPPYFGLRDYGVDGQMGLESTPAEFVEGMVELFREVRRVLRDDGTLWLNLGDSYTASPGQRKTTDSVGAKQLTNSGSNTTPSRHVDGLAPKQLLGIPWRVAFALQADGWWLRQDIIWSKPNPMPESVSDRCTKAHEYLFLLSKSPRYFYDADAIAEGLTESSIARLSQDIENQRGSDRVPGKTNGAMKAVSRVRGLPPRHAQYPESSDQSGRDQIGRGMGRNKRSVWTVATQPFSGAHFATFPPALIEPCILAGAAQQCCGDCGAPWERMTEKELRPTAKAAKTFVVDARDHGADRNDQGSNRQRDGHRPGWAYAVDTVGFRPSCACYDALYRAIPEPRSQRKRGQRAAWTGRWRRVRARPGLASWPSAASVVLDPFGGAGTTGLVGDQLGRDVILIELNPDYADLARHRLRTELCQVRSEAPEPVFEHGPLFGSAVA